MDTTKKHPTLYIIAGSNGAGKTTFALKYLPKHVGDVDFINADLIAKGLSPLASDTMVIQASRIFLKRIKELSRQRINFAFETTLSGRSYYKVLQSMKNLGYKIHMFYLWVPNYKLAIERIKSRVEEGGHNVPSSIVKRRFSRTLTNLFHIYLPLIDYLAIFENSSQNPRIVLESFGKLTQYIDIEICERIKREANWSEEEK